MLPAVIFISILCIARFNDPPNGNTGAPGEGICTNCHNPGNPNGYNGSISISGLPGQTTAGQQYSLTVTVQNPDQTAVRGGFQIVALDESDQNAGTLSNPGPSSRLSTSAGRTYHEHNPGRNFNGNSAISWTVNWTAPMVQGNETVTFYGASVIANGNGGSSGDLTVSSQTTTNVQGNSPPLSVIIISQNNPDCFGENTGNATAEASGGTPPYDYIWSTGGSNATETNMPAGNHSVMVFDQGGGNAQATVTLVEPPQLNSAVSISKGIDCPGGNDGILSVSASGGTPPLNFIWSNGQSGNTIQGVSAGTYNATVEDINGCQSINAITINDPDPITFTLNSEDVSCYGINDGIGRIENLAGGNPGLYNFEWSDGFSNSGLESIRTDLGTGTFTITITDSKNCETSASLQIGSPDSLSLSAAVSDVRCYEEENGSISLSITGGTPGYTINWSDGSTGLIRQGLLPGNYQVTVTDQNGCNEEGQYSILEPDSLAVFADTVVNSQCGDSSGVIALIIEGGNSPYSFLWNHGDTTEVADSLLPGEYIVLVTDSLGCTATDTFTIIVEDIVGPEIQIEPVTAYLDSTGMYTLSESDISYTVMDQCSDSTIISIDLPVAKCSDLNDTLFGTILATDQIGNTTEELIPIIVKDSIPPEWTSTPSDTQVTICSAKFWYDPDLGWKDNCGEVIFSQVSGPSIPDSLPIGDYVFDVLIADSSGNTKSHSWSVIVNASNISGELIKEDVSCFGENDGRAEFIPDDPGLIKSQMLSPVADPDSLQAGAYEFILEDTNGCKAIYTFSIDQPDPIIIGDTIITPATSNQAGDGMISVTISGGTPPYLNTWFNGPPGSGTELPGDSTQLSGLDPGTYYLLVIDSKLCSDTFSFTLGLINSVYNANKDYSLIVFPNPANGMLTLRAEKLPDQLSLFTIEGRAIDLESRWAGEYIDLSGLKPGLYVIVANWNNGERQIIRINLIN